MTTLPRDRDNTPIPAMRLNPQGAHVITATGTTNRNGIPFDNDTRVVSIYATGAVYLKFGDDTVVATTNDHYFPKGVYYDIAIGGDKTLHTPYLSVLAQDADCVVYVSEKE